MIKKNLRKTFEHAYGRLKTRQKHIDTACFSSGIAKQSRTEILRKKDGFVDGFIKSYSMPKRRD